MLAKPGEAFWSSTENAEKFKQLLQSLPLADPLGQPTVGPLGTAQHRVRSKFVRHCNPGRSLRFYDGRAGGRTFWDHHRNIPASKVKLILYDCDYRANLVRPSFR